MMSLMGFGQTVGAIGSVGSLATAGTSLLGLGAVTKGIGNAGINSNKALSGVGGMLSGFGQKLSSGFSSGSSIAGIGNMLSSFGGSMQAKANSRLQTKNKEGLTVPITPNKLSRFGERMMSSGHDSINSALDTIIPNRNMYRRRSRYREE
jgi:hypothetical protein